MSRTLTAEQLRVLLRDAVMRAAGIVLQRWRDEACKQDVYVVRRNGEQVAELRVAEESMVGFLGSPAQLTGELEAGVEETLWREVEARWPPGMCVLPRPCAQLEPGRQQRRALPPGPVKRSPL